METVQELIPLAKELMAQKPSAKLVRMYVLGGVLALFSAPREQGKPLDAVQGCRALSNRLHAS
nr:PREDICTED: G0/G1 switch protein 2 [Bos mutus]